VHYGVLLNNVDLNYCSRVTGQIVKMVLELGNIGSLKFTYAVNLNVKISSEVMDVSSY
jgi:hypothetical protein